jgi:hypothetical protein
MTDGTGSDGDRSLYTNSSPDLYKCGAMQTRLPARRALRQPVAYMHDQRLQPRGLRGLTGRTLERDVATLDQRDLVPQFCVAENASDRQGLPGLLWYVDIWNLPVHGWSFMLLCAYSHHQRTCRKSVPRVGCLLRTVGWRLEGQPYDS